MGLPSLFALSPHFALSRFFGPAGMRCRFTARGEPGDQALQGGLDVELADQLVIAGEGVAVAAAPSGGAEQEVLGGAEGRDVLGDPGLVTGGLEGEGAQAVGQRIRGGCEGPAVTG